MIPKYIHDHLTAHNGGVPMPQVHEAGFLVRKMILWAVYDVCGEMAHNLSITADELKAYMVKNQLL